MNDEKQAKPANPFFTGPCKRCEGRGTHRDYDGENECERCEGTGLCLTAQGWQLIPLIQGLISADRWLQTNQR